jgi:hypothetical protein
MYVSWKVIRGKLLVGLTVLLLDFGGLWFVANFYGFDWLPRWSTIVAKVQEFEPTRDNFYDGIRASVDLVRDGLEKVEHFLRVGRV